MDDIKITDGQAEEQDKLEQADPAAQQTGEAAKADGAAEAQDVAGKEDAPAKDAKPDEPAKADKAKEDKPDALSELRAQLKASNDRALRSEASAAALKLGVAEGKVQYALRLADLTGVDINADDAGAKIEAAIGAVLEGLPELKGGVGTGSVGNFARQQTLDAQAKMEAQVRNGLRGY